MKRLLILMLLICFGFGCGKKGPPKPPENFAPAVVMFFSADGVVDGVNLSWQEPESKANGEDLDDLVGFVVMKRAHLKDGKSRYRKLAEIPAKKPADSNKQTDETVKLSYRVLDREVEPGKRYEYYVTAYNEDSVEGVWSPVLRVTFVGESSIVENVSSIN